MAINIIAPSAVRGVVPEAVKSIPPAWKNRAVCVFEATGGLSELKLYLPYFDLGKHLFQ